MTAEQLASEHGEALIRARQGAAKVSARYGVELDVAQNALMLARRAKRQRTSDAADAITAYFSKPTKPAEPQPLRFPSEPVAETSKPKKKRTRVVLKRKKPEAPEPSVKTAVLQALKSAPALGGASMSDTFYCRRKDESLLLEECLDSYLDANAFRIKSDECFNCQQGCANRNAFARGLPLPD